MKTRMLSLILCFLLLAGIALPLSSCSKGKKPPEGTYTRMTVDVNPSIEFMVDDENKVASVTALNDDGSILIAGEAIRRQDAGGSHAAGIAACHRRGVSRQRGDCL